MIVPIVFFTILAIAMFIIAWSWCRRNSRDEMHKMIHDYYSTNKHLYNHDDRGTSCNQPVKGDDY